MESVIISSKGQILIPKRIRIKYQIEAGSTLLLEEKDDAIVLKPITKNYIKRLRGILKPGNLAKEMQINRKEELENEDRKF